MWVVCFLSLMRFCTYFNSFESLVVQTYDIFTLSVLMCVLTLVHRSTTKDSGGLLAAGLAGATSYYCHGNQCEGRESYQVSAVLARQWQEGTWTFPSDHNWPASLCRLHYQNTLCLCKSVSLFNIESKSRSVLYTLYMYSWAQQDALTRWYNTTSLPGLIMEYQTMPRPS